VKSDYTLTLTDGRTLGWCQFGAPDGVPVIALHGTPGSRLKFADSDGVAIKLGLRLISVDRWGYGLSSMRPGGALADFGCDMVELADRLGLDRCLVVGVSGGGPYAVATAAALGSRTKALALVSPIGIISKATTLSPFHYACFRVLPHVPGAIRAVFQLYRFGLGLAPNATMRLALSQGPAIDRHAIKEDAVRHRLIATFAGGLNTGTSGAVRDIELFVRPWDIDLTRIAAPVRIWIGTADKNVPQDGVLRLQGALPGSELVHLPDEGHLWIARNGEVVMAWLAAQTRHDGHEPRPQSTADLRS